MPESKLVESILFEAPPVVQYPLLLPEDGKPSKEERKLAIHAMQLRLRGHHDHSPHHATMRQANIIEASAFKSCVDQKSYHKILLNTMHIIEDGIQDAHTRRLSNVMQAMLGGLADVDNAAWTTSTDGTSDLRRTIGIEGRLEILNWRFEKRKWAVFQKKARAGADGEDLALPDINLEDLDDEMLAFFDDDAATDLTMADVGKDGVVEAPQLASTVVSKAKAAPIRL